MFLWTYGVRQEARTWKKEEKIFDLATSHLCQLLLSTLLLQCTADQWRWAGGERARVA